MPTYECPSLFWLKLQSRLPLFQLDGSLVCLLHWECGVTPTFTASCQSFLSGDACAKWNLAMSDGLYSVWTDFERRALEEWHAAHGSSVPPQNRLRREYSWCRRSPASWRRPT